MLDVDFDGGEMRFRSGSGLKRFFGVSSDIGRWVYKGVSPGLVISVVGLAKHSLDLRLVRDLKLPTDVREPQSPRKDGVSSLPERETKAHTQYRKLQISCILNEHISY